MHPIILVPTSMEAGQMRLCLLSLNFHGYSRNKILKRLNLITTTKDPVERCIFERDIECVNQGRVADPQFMGFPRVHQYFYPCKIDFHI